MNSLANEKELQYCARTYNIGKMFWKIIEKEWSDWLAQSDKGININEHTILTTLYIHEKMSVSELATIGAMHISTALNFSKKLEKRGLIETKKSNSDRRKTYISITEAGKEMVQEIDAAWDESQSFITQESQKIEGVLGEKPDYLDSVKMLKVYYGKEYVDKILNS